MKLRDIIKSGTKSIYGIEKMPKEAVNELSIKIRKKAVIKVKKNLKKYKKDISELSDQDIEGLIATEENKIKNRIVKGGLGAVLSLFGINLFLS